MNPLFNHRGMVRKSADLRGANFSNCDLRGAVFSECDLGAANFEGARIGISAWWILILSGLCIFAPVLLFIGGGMGISAHVFADPAKYKDTALGLYTMVGASILFISLFFILGLSARLLLWLVIISFAGTLMIFLAIPWLTSRMAGGLVGGLVPAWFSVFAVVFFQIVQYINPSLVKRAMAWQTGILLLIFLTIFVGFPLIFGYEYIPGDAQRTSAEHMQLTMTFGLAIGISVALWWFNVVLHRKVLAGDSRYEMIAILGKNIKGLFCTKFVRCNIDRAIFRLSSFDGGSFVGSSLRKADFLGAVGIEQCEGLPNWLQDATIRHLAVTRRIPASPIKGKNFEGVLLAGGQYAGADFESCTFCDVDLSDSDLRCVNFLSAHLRKVNLSRADISGSCISGWSIDSGSDLTGVTCTHVFGSIAGGTMCHRLPQSGDFGENEFKNLYQKVSSEVDLLFNSNLRLKLLQEVIASARRVEDDPKIRLAAISARDGARVLITIQHGERTDPHRIREIVDESYKICEARWFSLPAEVKSEKGQEMSRLPTNQTIHVHGNMTVSNDGGVLQMGGVGNNIKFDTGSDKLVDCIAALTSLSLHLRAESGVDKDQLAQFKDELNTLRQLLQTPVSKSTEIASRPILAKLKLLAEGASNSIELANATMKVIEKTTGLFS